MAQKTRQKELTPGQRGEICGSYYNRESLTSLVARFQRPYSTIPSFVYRQCFSGDFTFETKPRLGSFKKTSARDERALLRYVNQTPEAILEALDMISKSTYKLSVCTIRMILKSHGKAKRKPCRKPYLRPKNKRKRRYCYKEEKKIKRDYNKVCWSDEVTFVIGEDGNCQGLNP